MALSARAVITGSMSGTDLRLEEEGVEKTCPKSTEYTIISCRVISARPAKFGYIYNRFLFHLLITGTRYADIDRSSID